MCQQNKNLPLKLKKEDILKKFKFKEILVVISSEHIGEFGEFLSFKNASLGIE
jgi:hypothetical protein